MKKLKVLDLFSGIGGFSLGLEATGHFETVAFCEIDKHCHKVLNKNFPNIPIYDDVKTLTGLSAIDVICGGFPCQDISIAGKQKGITNETRSGLWFEFRRLISEIKPKYAIIENVEQLRKNGLGLVLSDLAKIGYDAEWHTIEATHVGLPHRRARIYIIAHCRSLRLYEYSRQERYVPTDSQWKTEKTYTKGEKCEFKSSEICSILSSRNFDDFRDSHSNIGAIVSSVRRVTDGISGGLYETERKQRIKQLGNSIIPCIAQIIGNQIVNIEDNIA